MSVFLFYFPLRFWEVMGFGNGDGISLYLCLECVGRYLHFVGLGGWGSRGGLCGC